MISTAKQIFVAMLALVWATFVFPVGAAGQEEQLEKYVATKDAETIENFPYQRYFTLDQFGRRITFYLSRPTSNDDEDNPERKPLVVCVQGSGSQSLFSEVETSQGTVIASGGMEAVVAREFRDRVRILVVEKPGVEFLVQPSRPGSSLEGSDEYLQEFSLERWVEAVSAALRATVELPGISQDQILVAGHSEGGQIACAVAAANDNVTHVAVMAGGGPTQWFDLLQMARSGEMYDPNATPEQRVEAFLADWQKVADDPLATDKFILGHSHLRWSTFLASSPIEAILQSKAKVFIAQGTADTNSLPASAEVLYAELKARGRDCTYLRIENADHGFMTQGDQGAGWFETNKKMVEWFLRADE